MLRRTIETGSNSYFVICIPTLKFKVIKVDIKKITFFLSLLTLSVSFSFAQSKEEKVWARVEALTKAVFETKDSAALVDLVSEHVTYGHSNGNLEDKKTMVSKAVAPVAAAALWSAAGDPSLMLWTILGSALVGTVGFVVALSGASRSMAGEH